MGNDKRPENPSYTEAKKFAGKGEKDKSFVAYMSGFWRKVGLNYKTIVTTSTAWCALFVVMSQSNVGQKYIASAAARRQGQTGIEINWRRDGIPRGAIVHINHGSNCDSKSGNHTGFADGDCAVKDILDSSGKAKKGAMFPIFGGNQSDMVKRSMFPVEDLCEVRWPAEVAKPGPVTVSSGCSGSGSAESTR